jgi:hypothetical protein
LNDPAPHTGALIVLHVRRPTSAMLRMRTRGQSIGICCDGPNADIPCSTIQLRDVACRDQRGPQSRRIVWTVPDVQHLRRKYSDWLLTLLTALLALMIFVFAPLQAKGFLAFQGFAIAGLLVIIGGVMIISANPIALALMCIAVVANVAVFVLRLLQPPWSYNLHLLAAAWLIIAITLGTIVAGAVFRRGRVTYHRIVGAVFLYMLVAVGFAALFAFVGLSIPDAFKGIAFEDDAALASELFYLSFATLTTTGYGDIVPVHPLARSLCNIEAVVGQLYPATLLARLVTLELRGR